MTVLLCFVIGYCGPTALVKAARGEDFKALVLGAATMLAIILYVQIKTGGLS